MLKLLHDLLRVYWKEQASNQIKLHKSKLLIYDEYLKKFVSAEELLIPGTKETNKGTINGKKSKELMVFDLLFKKFVNPKLDILVPGVRNVDFLGRNDTNKKQVDFNITKRDYFWGKNAKKKHQVFPLPPVHSKTSTEREPAQVGWAGQKTKKPQTDPRPENGKSECSLGSGKDPNKKKSSKKKNKKKKFLVCSKPKEIENNLKEKNDANIVVINENDLGSVKEITYNEENCYADLKDESKDPKPTTLKNDEVINEPKTSPTNVSKEEVNKDLCSNSATNEPIKKENNSVLKKICCKIFQKDEKKEELSNKQADMPCKRSTCKSVEKTIPDNDQGNLDKSVKHIGFTESQFKNHSLAHKCSIKNQNNSKINQSKSLVCKDKCPSSLIPSEIINTTKLYLCQEQTKKSLSRNEENENKVPCCKQTSQSSKTDGEKIPLVDCENKNKVTVNQTEFQTFSNMSSSCKEDNARDKSCPEKVNTKKFCKSNSEINSNFNKVVSEGKIALGKGSSSSLGQKTQCFITFKEKEATDTKIKNTPTRSNTSKYNFLVRPKTSYIQRPPLADSSLVVKESKNFLKAKDKQSRESDYCNETDKSSNNEKTNALQYYKKFSTEENLSTKSNVNCIVNQKDSTHLTKLSKNVSITEIKHEVTHQSEEVNAKKSTKMDTRTTEKLNCITQEKFFENVRASADISKCSSYMGFKIKKPCLKTLPTKESKAEEFQIESPLVEPYCKKKFLSTSELKVSESGVPKTTCKKESASKSGDFHNKNEKKDMLNKSSENLKQLPSKSTCREKTPSSSGKQECHKKKSSTDITKSTFLNSTNTLSRSGKTRPIQQCMDQNSDKLDELPIEKNKSLKYSNHEEINEVHNNNTKVFAKSNLTESEKIAKGLKEDVVKKSSCCGKLTNISQDKPEMAICDEKTCDKADVKQIVDKRTKESPLCQQLESLPEEGKKQCYKAKKEVEETTSDNKKKKCNSKNLVKYKVTGAIDIRKLKLMKQGKALSSNLKTQDTSAKRNKNENLKSFSKTLCKKESSSKNKQKCKKVSNIHEKTKERQFLKENQKLSKSATICIQNKLKNSFKKRNAKSKSNRLEVTSDKKENLSKCSTKSIKSSKQKKGSSNKLKKLLQKAKCKVPNEKQIKKNIEPAIVCSKSMPNLQTIKQNKKIDTKNKKMLTKKHHSASAISNNNSLNKVNTSKSFNGRKNSKVCSLHTLQNTITESPLKNSTKVEVKSFSEAQTNCYELNQPSAFSKDNSDSSQINKTFVRISHKLNGCENNDENKQENTKEIDFCPKRRGHRHKANLEIAALLNLKNKHLLPSQPNKEPFELSNLTVEKEIIDSKRSHKSLNLGTKIVNNETKLKEIKGHKADTPGQKFQKNESKTKVSGPNKITTRCKSYFSESKNNKNSFDKNEVNNGRQKSEFQTGNKRQPNDEVTFSHTKMLGNIHNDNYLKDVLTTSKRIKPFSKEISQHKSNEKTISLRDNFNSLPKTQTITINRLNIRESLSLLNKSQNKSFDKNQPSDISSNIANTASDTNLISKKLNKSSSSNNVLKIYDKGTSKPFVKNAQSYENSQQQKNFTNFQTVKERNENEVKKYTASKTFNGLENSTVNINTTPSPKESIIGNKSDLKNSSSKSYSDFKSIFPTTPKPQNRYLFKQSSNINNKCCITIKSKKGNDLLKERILCDFIEDSHDVNVKDTKSQNFLKNSTDNLNHKIKLDSINNKENLEKVHKAIHESTKNPLNQSLKKMTSNDSINSVSFIKSIHTLKKNLKKFDGLETTVPSPKKIFKPVHLKDGVLVKNQEDSKKNPGLNATLNKDKRLRLIRENVFSTASNNESCNSNTVQLNDFQNTLNYCSDNKQILSKNIEKSNKINTNCLDVKKEPNLEIKHKKFESFKESMFKSSSPKIDKVPMKSGIQVISKKHRKFTNHINKTNHFTCKKTRRDIKNPEFQKNNELNSNPLTGNRSIHSQSREKQTNGATNLSIRETRSLMEQPFYKKIVP